MKKYIGIIGVALLCLSIFSCNKKDFDYPEGTVGSSKVTNYAVFSVTGGKYVSIVKGNTYTEPGVTAKEGSADLKVTTSGQVDSNKPGLYVINYSATNSDGFPASATRYVAVLPTAEAANVNIAGDYDYAPGGYTATITKLAPGFYSTSNLWNVATVIPAYIITTDGLNWTIPLQSTGFGRMQGTATLAGFTGGSALNYKIDLLDQDITGSTRRWIKK